MNVEDLERVWAMLAGATAAVGAEKTPLFLAKLALLLANELGDAATIERLIATARQDL